MQSSDLLGNNAPGVEVGAAVAKGWGDVVTTGDGASVGVGVG